MLWTDKFPDNTAILDDAYNNEMTEFLMGFGSLCRFEIAVDGDYFVGVTGFSAIPFDGAQPMMNYGALVGSAILGYLSFSTFREQR